jgi:hypothetical protein
VRERERESSAVNRERECVEWGIGLGVVVGVGICVAGRFI